MLLSIIVPVYNAEKYLRICVDSILAQTFCDFELILVNDGSTDNSENICKEYCEKDSRVRYFYKENGGAASAKNLGIMKARGSFCEFVDSDDYLDKEYTEKMLVGALNNQADLGVGNIKFLIKATNTESFINIDEGFFSIQEFLGSLKKYLPHAIIGTPCNKIYKLSIIREHSLALNEKLSNNEDTQFNYDYLLYCKSVYVSNTPYYNYVNWGMGSLSHRYIPNLIDIYLSSYKKLVYTLKQLNSYEENISVCDNYFFKQIVSSLNNIAEHSDRRREMKKAFSNLINKDEIKKFLHKGTVTPKSKLEKMVYYAMVMNSATFLTIIFGIRKVIKRAIR